jgi:hypothetical protein
MGVKRLFLSGPSHTNNPKNNSYQKICLPRKNSLTAKVPERPIGPTLQCQLLKIICQIGEGPVLDTDLPTSYIFSLTLPHFIVVRSGLLINTVDTPWRIV